MDICVRADFGRRVGPVKPMHGINNAPFHGCDDSMLCELTAAGIP